MEKSTKKVLVVAGVTITLGTGGFIGYKVIKNKRIRAEQVRLFNEDNNIIRALEEVKDPDMYRKFNKMYHDRVSDFANAKSNRKFNEAGVKLDELMHEINEYLCEHDKEIQELYKFDENADNKEVAFRLRVAQFIYKTFDNHEQSDVIKKIIEKSSKYPDDINDLVSEKDYKSIGYVICETLVKEFDIDLEYLNQNPVVSSLIKLYLIKCKKKGLFEKDKQNNTNEEKEVRKGKKNKKNKKKDKNKKEVKEETKDEDQEEEMNANEEKVVKEETSDEDETIKETNEEEAVTDDKENDEENNNTKEEKEVRKDKKKKDKKEVKEEAVTNDEENEEEKNDTKEEKEVKEETSDEDETIKETNEVEEETNDKDQEEADTNDEEKEEENNNTKEEKEVRKNKKNKKDKKNKKKENKVEKEKCERDQEAVATDDEEKEVRKDRKKNKKRNKNKKMTKDESFKEKDNNENEEGECHNEVSNTTDEENCDDERFDEGLVKDICGVKVDFTDDDEDDEEDEYVEKDNLKKLLFNSMDEDDEDEDVENNVEPEIVECPTEADFEDSPRMAYFDMIEYRKDILNSTTYNIKERFQNFNDSIHILNTKEHYGYYHECLEVIFSILSLDEPEEHTLTRLDTFFKEFDKMVKPVIEKRKKDITTIAR